MHMGPLWKEHLSQMGMSFKKDVTTYLVEDFRPLSATSVPQLSHL